MKQVILDTDIGVDCDDAAAIAILLNYQKMGLCKLLAITASSTREGATSTVQAICDYYGVADMPIGAMSAPAIPCDAQNNYAYDVMKKYGAKSSQIPAVELLRKTLASATEKITLIAIGPLSNVSRLLKSGADEYSPLNGEMLVAEKVECLYLMGGAFADNYDGEFAPKKQVFPEWNILQDIDAARFVAERFPCKMVYCPHEAGNFVYTDIQTGDNPVWYSMLKFAENMENNPTGKDFKRMSWDPITCIVAVEGVKDFYGLSREGRISVDEKGVTLFDGSKEGGHRYLTLKGNYDKISAYVNSWVEKR